jgi:hypothetical protein
MKQVRAERRDEPILLREAARPGALSGLFAAVVMALFLMLFASREGDMWQPIKMVAATVLGERAIQGSGFQAIPVFLGMGIHLTMGVILGVFFAWLGGYLTMGVAMGWGLIFGLAVWVIMQFGLLPVLNPWMATLPTASLAISHALFGLSLGTYPRFLKRQETEMPQVMRKAA